VKRDFLSLADLTPAEIEHLLALAAELKQRQQRGEATPLLAGKTLALLFEKPSLRTRASFDVGMYQLGGHTTIMQDKEIGIGVREPIQDIGRVLSRYYDAIAIRTFAHTTAVELAHAATIPVINALTDLEHPCQILAALQTLQERFGHLRGLHVAYVGDGNNVANSWLLGAAQMGLRLTIACPRDYRPDAAVLHQAEEIAETTGATLWVVDDPHQGVKGADVVYTDVWASMGQEQEAIQRRTVFRPYQVDATLVAEAAPQAVVMHCLPAHRGEEITDEVFESPQSLAFTEAEDRLHMQKALLVFLLAPEGTLS
jgi:ornithine carbamoyltransferase